MNPTRTKERMRSERLEARISIDQKALLERAAELQGRTLTDFVLASVHEAAVRTIREMELIHLTAAESRAFADALLAVRKPSEAMRRAARRHREMIAT